MVRTSHQHIRDWLKALGSLAASTLTAKEFDARISAYAPLLAADFPQAAFGPTSLAAVARQCKFFPSYAELCAHLGSWWKEHRPPPTVAALNDPKARTNEEWRQAAELSWSTATAFDVRSKVTETQRITVAAHRNSLGRMLAHAVATHAPTHLGLVPPEWQDNAP